MTNIDKHVAGSFCWIELATSDQSGAKQFYSSLFAWKAEDMPMGPDDFYTMFRLNGRDAAAAYTLRADQRAQKVPPNWMVYIQVDNADDKAAKAKQIGGTVLADPFDVFDIGRMSVIQDPTGGVFSIWQPKEHMGIGISAVDGTLSWADLSTPDPERASKFYADLFGWQMVTDDEDPEHDYIHIKNEEHFIGGIPPVRDRKPGTPPHWLIYFHVSNCDAFANKAKQLGGTIYLPPVTMENVRRMAVLADPQQAVFALFQPMPHTK